MEQSDWVHFISTITFRRSPIQLERALTTICSMCAPRADLKKGDLLIPDPATVGFGGCLRVHRDGTIEALQAPGELLIDLLRLDDEDTTRYRRMMLEMLVTLGLNNQAAFVEWMGYPKELPDLSRPRKKPPGGNSRPDGIAESCFWRRARRFACDVLNRVNVECLSSRHKRNKSAISRSCESRPIELGLRCVVFKLCANRPQQIFGTTSMLL